MSRNHDFEAVRCPLCFTELDQNQFLIRFCPSDVNMHKGSLSHRFACTLSNLDQELHCWRPACHEITKLSSAVHFLHVGCSKLNPFWVQGPTEDEGTVQIEDLLDIERLVIGSDGQQTIKRDFAKVTHWQLELLRKAQEIPALANRREMWFPQLLLRSMYQRRDGRVKATRIKLGGEKAVGKSLAATMVAASINIKAESFLGNYVYLPRAETAKPVMDFLSALYPFQILNKELTTGTWWVPPSKPRSGLNLKSVFYVPASASPAPRPRGNRGIIQEIWKKGEFSPPHPDPNGSVIPAGVLFYDTAGEDVDALEFLQLDQCADVVAAVVSPTDFVAHAGERDSSIANGVGTAISVIEGTANPRATRCLIVTKLDLLKLSPADKQMQFQKDLDAISSDHAAKPGNERQVLLQLLRDAGNGVLTTQQKNLAAMVANPNRIHRVFFIWSEGANQPNKFPVTHGVTKFLAWCNDGARPEGDPAPRDSRKPEHESVP
jgi:hypothetical protein